MDEIVRKEKITAALEGLCIRIGERLTVHMALRSLGFLCGRVKAVIETGNRT